VGVRRGTRTHVYLSTLDQCLSDVFAARNEASDSTGYIVLLQNAGNDFSHRDGTEGCGGGRFPNCRVARSHRNREIPEFIFKLEGLKHERCEYTNQPYTATGKLNADKTPRTPRGFGTDAKEERSLSD
jgi:hypothetical protein